MIRRNDFSVLNQAVATQRNTIAPSRQRLTRPVRWRTPECGDLTPGDAIELDGSSEVFNFSKTPVVEVVE